MTGDPATFQRARRPEHKRQRYDAILEAARSLALRDGIRNVSLADIAGEVGMHKSALLRYFGTRDEIYLHLATVAWRDWADAMRSELAGVPVGSTAPVAAAFARTLADRPLLCDLLTHVPLNLERNVSVESARTYKLAALAAVADINSRVNAVLPELTDADTFDLIASVTCVAGGLWQVSHPPAVLRALYDEDPRLGHAQVEFVPSLRRIAETVLIGLLHRRRDPSDPGV